MPDMLDSPAAHGRRGQHHERSVSGTTEFKANVAALDAANAETYKLAYEEAGWLLDSQERAQAGVRTPG